MFCPLFSRFACHSPVLLRLAENIRFPFCNILAAEEIKFLLIWLMLFSASVVCPSPNPDFGWEVFAGWSD